MHRILPLSLIAAIAFTMSGCSWFFGGPETPESRIEQLKLPPDLTREQSASAMAIPEGGAVSARGNDSATGQPVLPQPDSVKVTRIGDDRWLTVSAPPERVWNWVSDFLSRRGIAVARSRPELGVAETEWLYTQRPVTGGPFAPVLPGPENATVADRYLVRVEPGRDSSTAEVFVAQRRAVRESDERWRPGERDPYLEAEFLRSMLVFMGYQREDSHEVVASASASAPQARVERVDGNPQLVIDNTFFDAWRRVGLALDRAGFTVEDRNRSDGVYFVRYDTHAETGTEPEEGFLSSLAFWRDEPVPDTVRTYRLVLDGMNGVTRVRVRASEDGPAPGPGLAERMLGLLDEQLR